MRAARHAPFNLNPLVPDSTGDHPPQPDPIAAGLARLATSLDRLTTVLETGQVGLGDPAKPRYTRPLCGPDLVDERTMAGILGISFRTLGKYRRQGRLPGCWIRNGGRVVWKVAETRQAWERGIA